MSNYRTFGLEVFRNLERTRSSRTGPVAWCDHGNSTDVKFLRELHSAVRARNHTGDKNRTGPWLDVTEALVSLPLWGVILKKLIVVKILHIMFVPHACGGEFWEFNSNVWDVVVGNKNRAFWHGIKCLHSCMTKLKVCASSCRCAFDLNQIAWTFLTKDTSIVIGLQSGTVIMRSNISCYFTQYSNDSSRT